MKHAFFSRRGYTLIELIVVIAIVGLMVGASIAGFNTLNQRQTVGNGGRELTSVMRIAQQRALAGTKPAGCTQLTGYRVNGTINTSDYTLSAVCTNTTVVISSYKLPSGVTFVTTIATLFTVQTGGAGGSIGDIAVRSTAFTYTLTVSSAGDITEKSLL